VWSRRVRAGLSLDARCSGLSDGWPSKLWWMGLLPFPAAAGHGGAKWAGVAACCRHSFLASVRNVSEYEEFSEQLAAMSIAYLGVHNE
jgi:hypothetical protein